MNAEDVGERLKRWAYEKRTTAWGHHGHDLAALTYDQIRTVGFDCRPEYDGCSFGIDVSYVLGPGSGGGYSVGLSGFDPCEWIVEVLKIAQDDAA